MTAAGLGWPAITNAQLVHPQMDTLGTHKGALQQTWPGHKFLLSEKIDHGEDQTGPARAVAADNAHIDHRQHNVSVWPEIQQASLVQNIGGHSCSCNLEHTYNFDGCSNGRCVLTSCDELAPQRQYQLSYLTQNVEAGVSDLEEGIGLCMTVLTYQHIQVLYSKNRWQ